MKSSRGKNLSLVVCEDTLDTVRQDNHICLSDEHIKSDLPGVIRLKKNVKNKLFGGSGDVVAYPVMFTSEIKKNQVFIPPEIFRDLSLKMNQKLDCVIDEIHPKEWADINKITFVVQNVRNGLVRGGSVDAHDLSESLRAAFEAFGSSYPLHNGQIIVVPYRNVILEMSVQGLEPDTLMLNADGQNFYRMTEATKIHFVNECAQRFQLTGVGAANDETQLGEIPLDFTAKGIGGYKKEIAQLIRALFYTRAMKKSLLDAYGVEKHSKGILLYGPPGTGKTLLATATGGLFTNEAVRIIKGPELKNSYYGATQQNLANLFIEPRRHPDKLYVYIFDEIDALFSTRGSESSVSMSNNNDLVSMFLSILDGPETLDNVIIIGTTNRKELIDPALLRAGRLETHIYIGLPDEKDRLEILQGHTKKMAQTLAPDVNLAEIAKLAKNYSGAELARVVSIARSYAMSKIFDAKNDKLVLRADIKSINQLEKVSQQYFLRALREVKPLYGVEESSLQSAHDNFIFYDDNLVSIASNFQQCIQSLSTDKEFRQLNYLISGPAGTGKTSLANYLALQSHYPHVQVLSADKLLSATLAKQIELIDEVFSRARQSIEPSIIILDTLEDLIESTPDYLQYNNRLRLKFNEVLKDAGRGDSKVLVIATTKNREFLQRLGLAANFAETESLSCVHLDCGNAKKCAAQLAAIAASIGVDTINDISAADNGVIVDISIKDLIYQIRKQSARLTNSNSLKISGFLHALPAEYRQVTQLEVVPQVVEVQSLTSGLFKRAGI